MADNLSELREAILQAVQRQIRYTNAGRAVDIPSPVHAPRNPLGASIEKGFEGGIATGYDGTNTTVPFTWGISVWGGGDVWTGS